MQTDLKLRPRMRRLLSPAITQTELVGIASWLLVLIIEPSVYVDFFIVSLTVALVCVCGFHSVATHFLIWRLLGVVYILLLSAGFSYLLQGDSSLLVFALPLALTLVISSAILFVNFQDYLLSAILVWLVIWPSGDMEAHDKYLGIFCAVSICIGLVLNLSYTKNLRTVLSVESEFRELAQTDYLTSILNRRAFMESFEKMLVDGFCGYFIMLDVDSFKLKNDQYGHDVGDKILCSMAMCLRSVKGSYSFGRIGGEEFGVLLLGDDESQASGYALNLLSVIRNSQSPPCDYTCSAGMARFSTGSNISDVLKTADRNMYMAKKAGKDCVYFHERQVRASYCVADFTFRS